MNISIFTTFSEQLLTRTAASEFTGNSHSFYPIFSHVYVGTGGKGREPILKISFSVANCYSHVMGYALQGVAT